MKKIIALMTVFFFLLGCATTIIKSKPSGAQVYIGGNYKGETPYTYTTTKSSEIIKLKKEGYKDNVCQIKKDKVNWSLVLLGLLFWPLWFSVMEFSPEYTFEMEKLE